VRESDYLPSPRRLWFYAWYISHLHRPAVLCSVSQAEDSWAVESLVNEGWGNSGFSVHVFTSGFGSKYKMTTKNMHKLQRERKVMSSH